MGRGPSRFSPRDLEPLLSEAGPSDTVYVALSGGADSTALLVALHELGPELAPRLVAVHVNHGIHEDAARWAEHCTALCRSLGIELRRAGPPDGPLGPGSPEERARRYRYDVFENLLAPGDILCTAHHRQDQAETLLLALLRGSGPAGLAAMPRSRPLGKGRLVRPLLGIDRAALEHWLEDRQVPWLTDPSNAELNADRNFLRHEILPRLRHRWPATDAALATSARLQAEANVWLSEGAGLALAGRMPTSGVLDLHGLEPATPAFRTILRHWLRQSGSTDLPRMQLEELCRQLEKVRSDSQVSVCWNKHRLRHYRGALWLDAGQDSAALSVQEWDGSAPLELGVPGGALELVATGATTALGERSRAADQDPPGQPTDSAGAPRSGVELIVRGRRSGDRLRPDPSGPSRDLKAWLSRSPLPPWFRDSVPVVPGADGLAALGDVVFDPILARHLRQRRLALHWRPAEPALAWAWRQCRASLLRVE